jgi:CBS domain-containing protein
MRFVKDLLDVKGRECFSVSVEATVYDALQLMAEHDVGSVLVMDGQRLAGILSERDYARQVVLRGRASHSTSVRDIMTAGVICVAPSDTVQHCMKIMTTQHVRHLPVREDERIIGLVSIGDVVKALLVEQDSLIRQLESYITGAA